MGWNWHAAIVLAACVGGTYGEGITANLSQLLSDDGLSSAFSNNLWINSGFGLYGLMALWLTLCLALHVLSVLGAALLGFFKQSEFEVHLMFRRKTKLPVRIRRILTNRAWPSKELVADRGSRTYLRIRWLYVLLARMGAGCFAGAVIRNGLATAEKLPGGIAAVVGGAAVLGLIWVVGRLIAAHLLLRSGRLPRLAFSVGSLAISLTVFVRFPAWAYVEGIGVGNLVGTIELPQLIFFGSALIVMAAVLTSGWLLFWLAKRLDGVARFIMKAMAIVSVTLCFLTIAQTEMNAGTNLRVRGTSEFAKTSYPIAACLQQIPVSGPPTAVWLLGNRDNQTVVSTRSPNGLALSSPGQVSILPTDSITLTLVPAEKREETEGVAELGVRPCSFAESQLDDEVPSHEAEVPSHEAGSLASLRFGLEF
ncbi:hypothetical protein ACIPY2_21785 [Paenarthrobacter sp. NPDC089675]|uniref:hypothetical protein n=1 Tax=Paenarthrobacter sp. NPDC089675 TaxID=3364376 RepID=UPI003822C6DC